VTTVKAVNDQPKGLVRQQEEVMKYKDVRVLLRGDYDLSRRISIGNARDNEVEEPITVREAVKFPTTADAKKYVDRARNKQKLIAKYLEDCLKNCQMTGQLYIDRQDHLLRDLSYNAHKDLTTAVTKVWQQFDLVKKDNWDQQATLNSSEQTFFTLVGDLQNNSIAFLVIGEREGGERMGGLHLSCIARGLSDCQWRRLQAQMGQQRKESSERARHYLRHLPGSIAGQNGDHHLVVGFGLADGDALELLRESNNRRPDSGCGGRWPPWPEERIVYKIELALSYADDHEDEIGFLLSEHQSDTGEKSPVDGHSGLFLFRAPAALFLWRSL
jgi:hypothetical protein